MKVLQIERIPIHHDFMNQSLSQVCKCDQFEAYTPIPYLRKGKCVTPFPKADPGPARRAPPPPLFEKKITGLFL